MRKQTETDIRNDELDRVMNGVQWAAQQRTPTAGARQLNMDDLQYYLFNRRRLLNGSPMLSPEEWFEAVR